ncbi:MAG: acyl-CoA carboxylase subunit epsilon [Ornithinimicrobium sp.]
MSADQTRGGDHLENIDDAEDPGSPQGAGPEVIVTGHPSPEQTAALVLVLATVSQAQASAPGATTRQHSLWNSRSRAARPPLRPGPGAWRASRLPR